MSLTSTLKKLSNKQLEKRLDIVQEQIALIYSKGIKYLKLNAKPPVNYEKAYQRLQMQERFIINERLKRLEKENQKLRKKSKK